MREKVNLFILYMQYLFFKLIYLFIKLFFFYF